MHSSGSAPAHRSALRVGGLVMTAIAAWLSVSDLAAQTATAQTAKQRFESAQERDEQVRVLLTNFTNTTPPADLVKQVSQVMSSFESIVRRFPASGYADNALWQAASLADAAYQRLNRQEDRDRAMRFYRWLVQEYPSSSFVKQANAKIASLGSTTMPTMTPAPVTVTTAPVGPAVAPIPSPERATLTSIQRVVLPNTVRVTIELDKEVVYREDRLSGPSRLFFDLRNVQLTPALMDKVLTYGSDVVSKIRVGRHPDNTVRVVLDFEEVTKYSVFTLYSPFRLVIDAERPGSRLASAATTVVPAPIPAPPLPASAKATPAPSLPAPVVVPVKPVPIREETIAPLVPEEAITPSAPVPAPLPSAPVI